jgi:hypothetical protein
MDEEKYRLIAEFLMSDVQRPDPQYVYEAIDNVLSGKSEHEELNGNVCGVMIHKKKTQIYDNLAEDEIGDWCEVETKELRELVEIWCNELKQFNEAQRNNVMQSTPVDNYAILTKFTKKLKTLLYLLYSICKKLFNLHKKNEPAVNFRYNKRICRSTFFPKHWSPQQVVDSINEAFYNKKFVEGTKNTFRGQTTEGLKIEMYIDNVTGQIISAFPKC